MTIRSTPAWVLTLLAAVACGTSAPSPVAPAAAPSLTPTLDGAYPMAIVKWLAADIGPRVTGSAACERAAAAMDDRFRALGLAHVHRETFDVKSVWEGATTEVVLVPRDGSARALRAVSLSRAGGTSASGVEAPIVTVPLDPARIALAAASLRGAIVYAARPYPATFGELHDALKRASRALRDAGAAALLLGGAPEPKVIMMTSDGHDEPLPAMMLARDDEGLLARAIEAGDARARVRVDVSRAAPGHGGHASNVIGEIPGTTREIVLVHAHLDTVYGSPGARDDAAGVAIVAEAMRILRTRGETPRRTIRAVLFSGEEDGYLGSRAYVVAHERELDDITTTLEIDSGAEAITAFDTTGRADAASALARWLAPSGVRVVSDGNPLHSDNAFFMLAGIVGLDAVQDTSAYFRTYHHRPSDTHDGIGPKTLAANGALVASVLVTIANRDARIGPRLGPSEIRALVAPYGADVSNLGAEIP